MIVAMVAPLGRRSSASTRACFEFAPAVLAIARCFRPHFGCSLPFDGSPTLRLDMPKPLSLVSAQDRAATT